MKILHLALALLFLNAEAIYGQSPIRLDDSYFFYTNGDNGEIVNVEKRIHLDKFKQALKGKMTLDEGETLTSFYSDAQKAEVVHLKKGNYIVDSDLGRFTFSINAENRMDGIASADDKRSLEKAEFIFHNGIMTDRTIMVEGNVRNTMTYKDSSYTLKRFYANGNVEEEEIFDLRLGERYNTNKTTGYYESGKLKYKSNKLIKTFIGYYENGKTERETDDINSSGKMYNENGKMHQQWYRKNDMSCQEMYYERD